MVCQCRFIRNTLGMCPQSTILLVEALNWEVTYKDLVDKVVRDPSNRECMMHCCNNCCKNYINFWKRSSVTLILIFNFTTLTIANYRASLINVTSTCEEYKDTLISENL